MYRHLVFFINGPPLFVRVFPPTPFPLYRDLSHGGLRPPCERGQSPPPWRGIETFPPPETIFIIN